MIGVIADSAEEHVAGEFFELFKTPWEFYRKGRRYDVLVCAGSGEFESESAKLVVFYAGRKTQFDDRHRIQAGGQRKHACILTQQGNRLPIYGESVTFSGRDDRLLSTEHSRQCVAFLDRSENRVLARVGYDLFSEVRTLLLEGQPVANAGMPALELHISFLRDLITGCGISLAEIPPVPDGYRFIACLTHDVDHPSIRRHRWDHTTLGFLQRAVFGSFFNLVRGRIAPRDLMTNWGAAMKLLLVHLGFANDFWQEFGDRYREIERDFPSTFFVIPFRNRPGKKGEGPAPAYRAARYGAQDIAETIQKLLAAGCEIALHGIDAWVDSSSGHEEIEEIRRLTGSSEIGVRMHWLYYDRQSPMSLEKAGVTYDSTVGYNETVGYRAGTMQAYRPLGTRELLELPMHVMDTALFYPAHLNLTSREAKTRITALIDNTVKFGGCLTINWHDRSVAPERLWGDCYRDLVRDLKIRGAWFATAGQATAWFRKRRSAKFETDSATAGGVRAGVAGDDLPGLRLRIHQVRDSREIEAGSFEDYVVGGMDPSMETRVAGGAGK